MTESTPLLPCATELGSAVDKLLDAAEEVQRRAVDAIIALEASRTPIRSEEPELTPEETDELVGRINANPNLYPVRSEDTEMVERMKVRISFLGEPRTNWTAMELEYAEAADRIEQLSAAIASLGGTDGQ